MLRIRRTPRSARQRLGLRWPSTAFPSPTGIKKSFPAINRPRGAGLGHDDFREQRQFRFQLFPDPRGDDFARGIFEAGNLVEVMMVQLFPQRLERGGEVGVIHQPAQLRVALARDDDLHDKTVPVEPAAFVT